jgi:hypothetical protein
LYKKILLGTWKPYVEIVIWRNKKMILYTEISCGCLCVCMCAGVRGCVSHVTLCGVQETPDPPEALSCIPSLQLSDIPPKAATIPTDIGKAGSATKLSHDLFTNDILYLEAALNLRPVPANLLPLVPLFCR